MHYDRDDIKVYVYYLHDTRSIPRKYYSYGKSGPIRITKGWATKSYLLDPRLNVFGLVFDTMRKGKISKNHPKLLKTALRDYQIINSTQYNALVRETLYPQHMAQPELPPEQWWPAHSKKLKPSVPPKSAILSRTTQSSAAPLEFGTSEPLKRDVKLGTQKENCGFQTVEDQKSAHKIASVWNRLYPESRGMRAGDIIGVEISITRRVTQDEEPLTPNDSGRHQQMHTGPFEDRVFDTASTGIKRVANDDLAILSNPPKRPRLERRLEEFPRTKCSLEKLKRRGFNLEELK
jgi:hypothetical protein